MPKHIIVRHATHTGRTFVRWRDPVTGNTEETAALNPNECSLAVLSLKLRGIHHWTVPEVTTTEETIIVTMDE